MSVNNFVLKSKRFEKARASIDGVKEAIQIGDDNVMRIEGTETFYKGAPENVNADNTAALVKHTDEVYMHYMAAGAERAAEEFQKDPAKEVILAEFDMGHPNQKFTATYNKSKVNKYPDAATGTMKESLKHMSIQAGMSELTGGKASASIRKEISDEYASFLNL